MNWLHHLIRTPARSSETDPGVTPAPVPDQTEVDHRRTRWLDARTREPEIVLAAANSLGQALALRAETPLPDDGDAIWIAAICHADREPALQWLATLSSDENRAAVALHARIAEVRLSAARAIAQVEVLDMLVREARHHDKAVYRHCADTLRKLKEDRALEQRAQTLQAAFEALLRIPPVSISHLLDLEKDLATLPADAPALAVCRDLCRQANEQVLEQAQSLVDLPRLRESVNALLADLAPSLFTWDNTQGVEQWLARFEPVHQRWAALPDWAQQHLTARSLLADFTFLAEQAAHLQADLLVAPQVRQFLVDLETTTPPADQALDAWDHLPALHTPFWHVVMQQHWDTWLTAHHPMPTEPAANPAESAPDTPASDVAPSADTPTDTTATEPSADAAASDTAARPPLDLDKLRILLQDIEKALDEGHFVHAEGLCQRWKKITTAHDLPRALDHRWQRTQSRLAGLRSWARWGANKQREQLIEQAHDLIVNPQNLDHLAVTVPSLRDAWKKLNTQGNAAKSQWELFDKTLSQAFEPVLTFRAAQHAQRQQAKALKQTMLQEWEAWYQGIDWAQARLDTLESHMNERMETWRKAAISGFREERLFRKSIDKMRQDLSNRLQGGRQTETDRRRALIDKANELVQLDNINQAIAGIKSLQDAWRSPESATRLLRGTEQKLWRDFRGACDAVFARRDSARQEKQASRQASQEQTRGVLDTFSDALKQAADIAPIQQALQHFNESWSAVLGAHPDLSPRQTQQADSLRYTAQNRISELKRSQKRQIWNDRIAAAPSGLDLTATQTDQVRKQRDELLIDLEIALGLPSPETQAIARRVRQMAQLQGRFRGNAPQSRPPEDLLRECCDLPVLDDKVAEKRLQVIVDRWLAREETPVHRSTSSPRPPSGERRHGNGRPGSGAPRNAGPRPDNAGRRGSSKRHDQ